MWYPCREAHLEVNPGCKAPPLEKMQPPGSPLSDRWSLSPADSAWLVHTPLLSSQGLGTPAEAILCPITQHPVEHSFPPSIHSSKSLLPNLYQQRPWGRSDQRTGFLQLLSHADHSSFFPPQPDCYLHLHLRWADNPYVSGTVHTKDTAPGLIMGAGRWLQWLLQPEGSSCLLDEN